MSNDAADTDRVAASVESTTRTESGEASALGRVAVVAREEYRLSVRNRWALALTGLFGLFALLLTAFSGSSLGPARLDAVLLSLAQLATYLLPLAALVYGYDTVVGAAEAGWLDIVFALPVPRSTVVVGKYAGRLVTLAAATLLGFGAAGAVFVATGGVAYAGRFAWFLLGAVAVGAAFLAVSLLVSTVAREKTHALGGVLVVWVWFVFVHDLLALGLVAAFDLHDAVLSAFVLANPADVFRVLVLHQLETTGGGLSAVFAGTGLSTPVLVVALLAWCVVPVALAGRLVARRSI
jgi:Cu-processing system permease protein